MAPRIPVSGASPASPRSSARSSTAACPRLVAWREQVAREKRAAFADETYWGRPIPGFGDPAARVLIFGLAPAAHGANRTGRIFTGDRSGDFLFAALHRAGFANQPISRHADDGLALRGAWITAAVRCAPPQNKPTPLERDTCLPFAAREVDELDALRVVVCLGAFAWDAGLRLLAARGIEVPRPRPRFGHLAELRLAGAPRLLGCFHPSQHYGAFRGCLSYCPSPESTCGALRHGSEIARGAGDAAGRHALPTRRAGSTRRQARHAVHLGRRGRLRRPSQPLAR
jgi:uracil-DNA glycosylase family 4